MFKHSLRTCRSCWHSTLAFFTDTSVHDRQINPVCNSPSIGTLQLIAVSLDHSVLKWSELESWCSTHELLRTCSIVWEHGFASGAFTAKGLACEILHLHHFKCKAFRDLSGEECGAVWRTLVGRRYCLTLSGQLLACLLCQ